MDAISDPLVQRVAWVAPSQVGKSEILLNTIGFYIDQDPSPMLMVQPNLDDAKDFSNDRVKAGLIDTSPAVRRRVRTSGGRRGAEEKILRKTFPGGHLTIRGANSATGLASRPIRIVLFDEVDKYPASAGDKGDPVTLASNRTKTFWNRKIVLVTTPGVKGASRIEKEWNESDQRRFYVPCPHCEARQTLRWANVDFDTACYVCESCGATIEERWKPWMLERGQWVAERPEGLFPGFHLNALYSPWTTWRELITKFLVAKKAPDTLRVFVNEDLAELWDPQDGEGINTDELTARREVWDVEVPEDVGALTAGVDVQGDRLELLVTGWCAGQRSRLIAHHRLYGDPKNAADPVWARLDALLTKGYQHGSGATLKIAATCVDSGDGNTVQSVYSFVQPRQRLGVYATKGQSVPGKPIVSRPSKKPNKYGVKVIPVGTDTAKDVLFARLKLRIPDGAPPPDGYVHVPRAQLDGLDDEFLLQFGREKAFLKHVKGVPVRFYQVVPAGARNEAIDLAVLCLVALHLLGAGVYDQLGTWVEKTRAEGERIRASQSTPAAPAPPAGAQWVPTPQMPRPRGGYVNAWRR